MKNLILSFTLLVTGAIAVNAQIGYQVALMDQSTGKPRANETVSVTVTISDNAGTNICQSTQNATTNDFGMLSVQVGNASSFSNVDWSKLPLWVSATVGGVTIGKSQILNIPVAEHAKHWGTLTKEMLTSKTWSQKHSYGGRTTITFSQNSYTVIDVDEDGRSYSESGTYCIENNSVFLKRAGWGTVLQYSAQLNMLFAGDDAAYQ